jgi:hypothetical protein
MRTIPDAVLNTIAQHRPDLVCTIADLRAHPDQAKELERAIATAYLTGEIMLRGQETWYLAQVAYGGPWGGDWWPLSRVAIETGYNHNSLRGMVFGGRLNAIKYGKTWYVHRDTLPKRETPTDAGPHERAYHV